MRPFFACLLAFLTIVSAPLAAWGAPPPGYPAAPQGYPAAPPSLSPPGAAMPAPRAPDSASRVSYDAGRKSEGVAVVIEFFLPGLGSVYAGHWQGAATTWGVSLVGYVTTFWGAAEAVTGGAERSRAVPLALWAGIAMIAGARVHGLVDAFRSTHRYNRNLARRLGLHGGMVLAPMPLQAGGQTTLGLGASWQF